MKYSRIRIAIIGTAAILFSLLYFVFPAAKYHFYPACPFHLLTGGYCPGCGSQRALSALLHGRWWQALSFNILFVLSIPFIVYSAFVYVWNSFSSRQISLLFFNSVKFTRAVLALILLFWVLRNLPYSPFQWLAP